MKMIGETETGEVIYNELNCDICGTMSGPRTRFDNCLACGATREQRLDAGHIGIIDLYLNSLKLTMEERAKVLRKRFNAKIELKIEFSAQKGGSSVKRSSGGLTITRHEQEEKENEKKKM